MADLARVPYGQPGWDKNFNAVVDAVNELMGGGEVTHIDNPLTFLNNAQANSSAYVISKQDTKIVILSVAHFNPGNIASGTPVATIPDSIAPCDDNYIRMTLAQNLFLANTGTTRLDLWRVDTGGSSDLYGTAVYAAKS